jgi:peptide/nickel transport system substrate-binding protein
MKIISVRAHIIPITSIILAFVILMLFLFHNRSSNKIEVNKYGGTVTIVPSPIGKFNCSFNPFDGGSNNTNCYGVNGLIYEPMIYMNQLTGQSTPWLAEQYSWSEDAKKLTLHLRQNVTWFDGYPLTSADVSYTFDILHRFPILDTKKIWNSLISVITQDTYTIVMEFSEPSLVQQWFVGTKTCIIPQHIWKSIDDPVTATFTNPIGTGPFMLKANSPDLYTMERNHSYWQPGKPYVNEVRFPSFESNTGPSILFAQGSLDWAGIFVESMQDSYVSLDPSHNHYWYPSNGLVVLGLNIAHKPFESADIRKAISLAIDREAIVNQAEKGFATVASPTGIVLPDFKYFLDPEYTDLHFHQDIQKARELLANAGYSTKESNGILTNATGDRLSFTLNTVEGWNDWIVAANLIAVQLRAVDIVVEVRRLSFTEYANQQQSGLFDMTLFSTDTGPSPFYNLNAKLDSQFTAPIGQIATANWIRWNDPKTDAILKSYREATNPSQQKDAIIGLEQIMVEQVPMLPLFTNFSKSEYSTLRFVGWPDEKNPYALPSPYSMPDIGIVLQNIHRS